MISSPASRSPRRRFQAAAISCSPPTRVPQALYDFINGATLDEVSITRQEGCKKLTHRYRWFAAAPLREGKDALMVDWIGLAISDAKGKLTYDGAFLTSLSRLQKLKTRWATEKNGAAKDLELLALNGVMARQCLC